MRFLTSLLVAAAAAVSIGSVDADLRMASQPKNAYKVIQRNNVKFVSTTALYMEPSDFNYAGLKQQRDNGAYDNFLRSNIDNEQDKRNFVKEAGRDMLPFRTYEATETDVNQATQKNKIPATAPGPAITATPGQPYLVPLRWNNPHASEIEVNVWIMDNKYVVPISKPTCSGEGHGDNVMQFTIPNDFLQLGTKVPGFNGCTKVGDCVLQIYAHSVEARTYAMGTPLIVSGTFPAPTAPDTSKIKPAQQDVGTDLTKLTHDLCLSTADKVSDITTSEPRFARLVSDQFNHAYQNSDYSPYSGQQPEAISRNLQAAGLLSMITGNRGELGKAYLAKNNPTAKAFVNNLETKAKNLVQKYEGITNAIIAKIGNNMKNTGTLGASNEQKMAECFRCAEVGSTTTTRQTTNTYVPSFVIPASQLAAAQQLVPKQYSGLITTAGRTDGTGLLQIYVATYNDLNAEFVKAAKLGINYQPAMIKDTTTTMADATSFKKLDANNKPDNGLYAATKAYDAVKAKQQAVAAIVPSDSTQLTDTLTSDAPAYPLTNADAVPLAEDMDGLNYDSNCDDDATFTDTMVCDKPTAMFPPSGSNDVSSGSYTSSSIVTALLSVAAALFVRA